MTDWDNVLGTKGYRVLDNVFYNDKHADDEEWLNPSGFTLMDPIVIDLEDVRARSKKNLREPPTTAGKMCAGKTFSRHLELGSLRFAGAFFYGWREGRGYPATRRALCGLIAAPLARTDSLRNGFPMLW